MLGVYLALSLSTQAQVIDSGLIGYWPFTGNANDHSLNANHGKVTGATLTTDRFGNKNAAYNFDGNRDYINLGRDNTLFPKSLTVNIWFQHASISNDMSLIGNSNSLNGEWGTDIACKKSSQGMVTGVASGSNNHGIYYISYDHYDDGEWHMFTTVYSAEKNRQLATYIDGCFVGYDNEVASSGGMATKDTLSFNTSQDWYVGAHSQYFSSTPNFGPRYYHGNLDDISLYNRALTPLEILKLYTSEMEVDTVVVYDTTLIPHTDTVRIYDTITTHLIDTIDLIIYDTVPVTVTDSIDVMDTTWHYTYDTVKVTVYDTSYTYLSDTSEYIQTVHLTIADTLYIDVPDDPDEPSKVCDIRVYPNPTDNFVYIHSFSDCSLSDYTIKVYNDIGQLIIDNKAFGKLHSLPLDSYASNGFYILELRNPKGGLVLRRKIVLY